jgi:hypothetical protein
MEPGPATGIFVVVLLYRLYPRERCLVITDDDLTDEEILAEEEEYWAPLPEPSTLGFDIACIVLMICAICIGIMVLG